MDVRCGTQVCSSQLSFYTEDFNIQTCGAGPCAFTTQHWALYGSVSGFVRMKNGTPLRNYPVIALDPDATPVLSYSKATRTDNNGFYTFTSKKAPIYSFESPNLLTNMDIPESNNWGLRIQQNEHHSPPEKTYRIRVRDQTKEPIVVTSSAMKTVSFEFPNDEADKDPPNKRCDLSESEEEGSCIQDASMTAVCPGLPVSVVTGNVFFDQTDVVLPGTVPIQLQRSYNSLDAFNNKRGLFGPGWSSSFEREIVFLEFQETLAVKKSNGSRLYFSSSANANSFTPYSPASGRSSILRMGSDYVRTLPSGRTETYNGAGQLASLADPVGNVTTFERESGLITAVTAPSGRSLRFSYRYVGNEPRVSAISGPEGTIATYAYDDGGRLVRTVYADGSGYAYAYDDRGQLLQMRDLAGVIVESHTYSPAGQGLTSETSGGVDRLSFSYQPNRTTVTDALGNVTHYDFEKVDELTVLKKITGPCNACGTSGGDTQEWTHDSQGRATSLKNGLGEIWSYTYDADGNRDTVTDPLNRVTTYTFDDRGRVLTAALPGGGGRTYTYGPAGLLNISDSLNHGPSLSYGTQGDVASFTTALGKTYTFSRNGHGDLTSVTDPLGRSTHYEVDASGRSRATTDPAGRTVRIFYDRRGRVAGAQLPTGAEWRVTYDKGGRQRSATDPAGRTTRYTYDRYGRLFSVLDPMNGLTTLAYDRMSNVTSITDPKHQTTRFAFDGHGRQTRVTYANGRFERFTYDAAGRPNTMTDRRGIVTTYHRDVLGRPTSMTYSDGTPSVTYTYDGRGRLESASSTTDSLTWGFDDADNVISETSSRNASQVSYSYDAGGLRLALGLDGAELLSYEWDEHSRLTTLRRGGQAFNFGYDEASRRTSLTYPNGVTTEYAYDAASRLTRISALAGATTLFDVTYGANAIGSRTSKGLAEFTEAYGYDALNRLTSIERNGTSPAHWHYGYDAVGNRTVTQQNEAVVTAAFDETNRLLSTSGGGNLVVQGLLDEPGQVTVNGVPGSLLPNNTFEATVPAVVGLNDFTVVARDPSGNERASTYRVHVPPATAAFTYDDDGRLIQKSDGSATWVYEWDARHQLTRVLKEGAEVARFSYDPLGRRVEKVAGGVTSRYVYDRTSILRETRSDAPGAPFTYIHSLAIDEALAREDASGDLIYYHADGLGSVTRLSDQAAHVVMVRQYDAWGNLEVGASEPGYAFTGREWDPEIGLYYYRSRYYDPKVGRFISEDPIGFAGGVNFYAYVGGNPAGMVDPLGLAAVGDVVMFQWGRGFPEHTALVTAVDAVGNPTRAFGGWNNGGEPAFQEVDLLTYAVADGVARDYIYGTGSMEGLTDRSLADVIKTWSIGHEIVVRNRHWAPEGKVCIDIATAVDGLGGNKLRNAMREDFVKNESTYRKHFAEKPSMPGALRQNLALWQFFVNTGRATKY